MLRLRLLRPNQQFVVPCVFRVRIVLANVPCGGLALAHPPLPVLVGGGSGLEVEVFRKGEGETLVQALLVEEVGLFEGGQIAGDLGRAGEEDSGIDDVAGGHDGVDGGGIDC